MRAECWEKLREGNYYVSGTGLSIFWAGTRGSHESTSGDTLAGGGKGGVGDMKVGHFSGRNMRDSSVSGWNLGYWRENSRRVQDGESERAMGGGAGGGGFW